MTGKIKNNWQDREPVLGSFGRTVRTAIRNYRKFVEDGVAMGRRPELVGGGLLRSLGGWSEVISMRRHGDREMSDGRILGDGDFVQRILEESEKRQEHHFSAHDRRRKIQELIVKTCEEENINPKELQSGSRRRPVSRVRSRLARQLVYDHGVPPASAARALGVSTSAVSKITRSTER